MVPWQKREDLSFDFVVLRKSYDSKPTAVTEPEVLTNAKQCVFMPTP